MFRVVSLKLYIPHSYSLKDKRQVLRSIIDKCKRINISIAETGENDKWNYSELTFAAVSNTEKHLQQMIYSVIDIIEQDFRIQMLDKKILI